MKGEFVGKFSELKLDDIIESLNILFYLGSFDELDTVSFLAQMIRSYYPKKTS